MDPTIVVDPSFFTTVFPGWSDFTGWDTPGCYLTIQCADIDGDGQAELLGRSQGPMGICHFNPAYGQWTVWPAGPNLSDAQQWDSPQYYSTIQCADIDGDKQAEIIARASDGIHVYKYDPGAGSWWEMALGPALSDAGGWDQVQYYSTIQCADVDGDGAAEIIARGHEGIYVFDYDPASQTWSPDLTASPQPSYNGPALSDLNCWDQPRYYSTIQCADIDGDKQAEIIARAPDGIHIYKYDPTPPGSWSELPPGPALSDTGGWDQVEYYSTIQCADVDGDDAAEIVARGTAGIYVFDCDPTTHTWSPDLSTIPPPSFNGPPLSDVGGWDGVEYYSTIRCADINGDGRAELLARDEYGMYVFFYDTQNGQWSPPESGPPLTNQAGYDQPQCYLTIRYADIDNDGQDELMVRASDGVHTWKYNTQSSSWASTSAPFPELTAYQAISTYLMRTPNADIRSQYDNINQNLSGFLSILDQNPPAPSGVDQADWQAAVTEIGLEISAAIGVSTLFSNLNTLLTETFDSDAVSLSAVANTLGIQQTLTTNSDTGTFNFLDFFGDIAWAMTAFLPDGLETVEAAIGGVASAISYATSFGGGYTIPTDPIPVAYLQLANQLTNQYEALLKANGNNQANITTDYGLLMTIGGIIQGGGWSWSSTLTPMLVAQAQNAYAVWLWQQLTPLADWVVAYSSNGQPPNSYPSQFLGRVAVGNGSYPAYIQLKGNKSVNPAILEALFNQPTNPTPGLGVQVNDVINGQNGWPKFPLVNEIQNPGPPPGG